MIQGTFLSFDLQPRDIHHEDFIVLEILPADGAAPAACKWHRDAGKGEVAAALRRLADRLENKI